MSSGKTDMKPTSPRRAWSLPLRIGGFLDCSLALYHLVLPYHMRWKSGLIGVPDSLVWALFALNFSWSILMLLTGLLMFYAAQQAPPVAKFTRATVFVVGLFWVIHGTYTWLHPLPLPAALSSLGVILMAFPLVAAILHWIPLGLRNQPRTASPS